MKNTTINNEMVLGGENMEVSKISQQVIELEAYVTGLENDNIKINKRINSLQESLRQDLDIREVEEIHDKIKTLQEMIVKESIINNLRKSAKEAANAGTVAISVRNKRELESYTSALKFTYKSVISVVNKEDGTIELTTKPLADGRYTEDATVIIGATVPKGKGSITLKKDYFAPFTKDFLTVTYKDKTQVRDVIYGIWVLHDKESSKLYIPYKGINSPLVFHNSQDAKEIKDEFTEEQLRAMGARQYKILSFRASGLRNATCLFMDVTYMDCRFKLLDTKGLKALSILQKEFDNKMSKELKDTITIEEVNALYANQVVKKAQRFGQLQTASHNLGVVPTWALLEENFGLSTNKHDGMNFVLDTFYAERLSAKLSDIYGYEITISPDAVLGELLQNRPAFMKSNGIVVDENTMLTIINGFKHRGYDVSVYGDKEGVPCVFVDRNSVKLNWDFECELDFHLLDIAKKSPAKLSIQMLTKAIFGANHSRKDSDGVTNASLKQQLQNRMKTEFDIDKENAFKGRMLTPGEFNNGFMNDVVKMIDERKCFTDATLRNSILNHFLKGTANKASKMKLKCNGVNVKLIDDYTDMIEGNEDARLIQYGEVYSPYYDRELRKAYREFVESLKATGVGKWSNPLVKHEVVVDRITGKQIASFYIDTVMFKYPSVGMAECYKAKAICSFTILQRAKARGYNPLSAKVFAKLTEGGAVVPASSLLMKKLAGMDFDFDGATLVADPIIVEACRKLPNYVTDIDC